jgi:TRAP-type C4-dicarboxylate transport system permease small subunit
MKFIRKLYGNFETYICVILMAVMIISLTAQLIIRVATGGSLPWAEEVARYCFITSVYLGMAVGAQRLAHVRVTAQFMLMPPKIRLIFRIIADTLLIAFNLALAYICGGFVAEGIQFGEMSATIGVNIAYVEAVIPIGALLMSWRIVESYLHRLKDDRLYELVAVETEIGLIPAEENKP